MIPVNEPLVGESENKYVMECLRTGWISSEGHFIHDFEERWAAYCGMSHGVAVSNGTVALEIAMACLDLQPGDEVIMPTFTIISCAQSCYDVRAEARTGGFGPAYVVHGCIPGGGKNHRAYALMPVHIYSHPVDMDPLQELARKHNPRYY